MGNESVNDQIRERNRKLLSRGLISFDGVYGITAEEVERITEETLAVAKRGQDMLAETLEKLASLETRRQ